jgi:hypothetical protein
MPEFPASANPNQPNGLQFTTISLGSNALQIPPRTIDFNEDGIPDFAVAVPTGDPPGRNNAGLIYVYGVTDYGVRPATIDLGLFDSPQNPALPQLQDFFGFRYFGETAGFQTGVSVAAGDVDGDGRADLIVGAPFGGTGGDSRGLVYVLANDGVPANIDNDIGLLDGNAAWEIFGPAPSQFAGARVAAGDFDNDGKDDIFVAGAAGGVWTLRGSDRPWQPLGLDQLNGTNGTSFIGFDSNNNAPRNLAAGDFNGDGFDDLVVASEFADPSGRANAGRIDIIFGTNAGLPATFNVTTLDGTNGFSIIGQTPGQRLGWSLATLDFNGDGLMDILAGAPPTNSFAGAAALVYGTPTPPAPLFDIANLNGTNGTLFLGVNTNDSGGVFVAGGDINGDGFDDALIGSADTDPNGVADAGSVHVVFGSATPLGPTFGFGAINGTNGTRIDGINQFGRSGVFVGSADFDGDGVADLAIGTQSNGNLTVAYGLLPDGPVTRTGAAGDQRIFGSPLGDTLNGLDGDDVLFGRGGNDLLNGNAGNDAGILGAPGDLFNGGDGTDTAVVAGYSGRGVTPFLLDVRNTEVALVPSVLDPRFETPNAGFSPYLFNLVVPDVSVIAGNRLEIIATNLTGTEGLAVDGSAVGGGGVWVFAGPGANMHVGGAGSDAVLHSTPYLPNNTFNGGAGVDSLGFRGDYTGANAVTLGAADLQDVETLVALTGLANPFGGIIVPGGFSYQFVLEDVGPLTVVGTSLGATESLSVDGVSVGSNLRFFGGAGPDNFSAGDGDGLFFGGGGSDILDGGSGNNSYVYRDVADSTPGAPDFVRFFQPLISTNVVDLTFIDADSTQDGNQDFTFIGDQAFGNVPGQLRAFQVGGDAWRAEGDINGDGIVDFRIDFDTSTSLTAGNFVG